MQAVILAAGKSTRTYPLTFTKPKPLLKVANKTLLEHNLDNLNGIVKEAIIVVGYKKHLIKKYIGNKYKHLKITFVTQKKQLGTGNAVSIAEHYIKDRFILMAGDDIYSKNDITNSIKYKYSILTAKSKNPRNFGVIIEKNRILVDFIEKPKKFISDVINTSLYVLDKKIFDYIKKIKKSKRNEFELPDAINLLSKEVKIHCVKSKQWLPIAYPNDLLKADKKLRGNKNIFGMNSRISGKVKNSSVGNNCIIKGNVQNSIIMDKTVVDENSVVEKSILGEKVYFSGKMFNSVIADNVKAKNIIVRNSRIFPGRMLNDQIIEHDV